VNLSNVWSNANRTELRNGYSGTVNGTGLSTFGTLARNYIEWIGFAVDAAQSGPRTEKALVTMHTSTGVKIRQCEIRGAVAQWSDNWSGVRYENNTNCDVTDCRIYGFYDAGGSHGWGILMYGGTGYDISNNEVYDCYGGICIKGVLSGYPTNGPGTIRFNLVRNVSNRGMLVMDSRSTSGNLNIHQNVIYSSARFGMSYAPPGTDHPRDVRFFNNTIANCGAASGDGAIYAKPHSGTGYSGCVIQNNIFSDNYAAILTDGNLLTPFATINRDLYSSASLAFNGSTFTAFQGTGRETNGAVGSAAFVNAAGRDYRLTAGSPAISLGRDLTTNAVIPAGAYITGTETIGVRS
jgi:hypothetical protein